MADTDIKAMLAEDERRRRTRHHAERFDPFYGETGMGHIPVRGPNNKSVRIPIGMFNDPEYAHALLDEQVWDRLRCRHDFPYWCARCVTIKDKQSGADTKLYLNRAQRIVLKALEEDRLNGRPIRMILLKARQWGGSTLIQMYMAWIQTYHRRNWHSLILAHVKDTSSGIRGMYSKLLEHYPEDLWEGDEIPTFKPYERSQNVRLISGRGCRVTVGSAENQDAIRGADYAMAHLSETAFWPDTPSRNPEDAIRAICGSIAREPYTLVVMESTANGVGNYFHDEWLRSTKGLSDKRAVFIPWYYIGIYTEAPADRKAFAESLDDAERRLWDMGLDLDQICWYRHKGREYSHPEQFHAEFPTTDTEAFANTGNGVFDPRHVETLRTQCREGQRGEVFTEGTPTFIEDIHGGFTLWESPQPKAGYIVAVDVGGRTDKADWSVIAVLKRNGENGKAEIVGQWRGHCDHDILARRAMAIGRWYNMALLVVESNSLESSNYGGGEDSLFVLNRMAENYPNIYRRECFDSITGTPSLRVGFHTNRSTKAMVIMRLVEAVREGAYIERCSGACDELITYRQYPNGSYGANAGHHDDILMTRAIAIHISDKYYSTPAAIEHSMPRARW